MILFAVYYFTLDIQWGFTTAAFTWGLPIVLASLVSLAAGILTIIKKAWKWGVAGLVVAVMALLYTGIMLHSFSYVLLSPQPEISPATPPSVENQILALALTDRFKGSDYTVIKPDTNLTLVKAATIKERLAQSGRDYTNLITRFFETNQNTVRLSVSSSIKNGFYIDYEGKFARYFENGGGGWLRLNIFHPQVSSYTKVSFPAYDPETGYVLLYIRRTFNTHSHPGGDGILYVYQYADGKLTLLDFIPLWVG